MAHRQARPQRPPDHPSLPNSPHLDNPRRWTVCSLGSAHDTASGLDLLAAHTKDLLHVGNNLVISILDTSLHLKDAGRVQVTSDVDGGAEPVEEPVCSCQPSASVAQSTRRHDLPMATMTAYMPVISTLTALAIMTMSTRPAEGRGAPAMAPRVERKVMMT
jgi:hypothetical protein